MFNRRKKQRLYDAAGAGADNSPLTDDLPEWEELLPDTDQGSDVPEYSFDTSSDSLPQGGQMPAQKLDPDFTGGIDVTQFPALRMAFGRNDDEQRDVPMEEYTAESDGEDGLSQLIRRYAELDEREEKAAQTAHKESGDDLPELFRQQSAEESIGEEQKPPEEEIPQEEFSMESETLKQQEISGELFDYIDTITSDTNSMIRQLDTGKISDPVVRYDPYNVSFNNKYDDTDEILSNTPEISLAPKYELNDGAE